MYLIQRRILIKIVAQTLFVFAFVGVIVTTTQVLNQVFRLIDASSNLWVALEMFVFLIPTITVSVLPIAFLIACINVYDRMDEDRESVILIGTGAHPVFRIVPAGVLALVLSGLIAVLSLFVEPAANHTVRTTIDSLKYDMLKVIAGNGSLQKVQDGLFIRGGGYNEEGLIDGLFILDRRDPAEEVSYVAQTGEFIEGNADVLLKLYNGSIQMRNTETDEVHRIRFGTYETEPQMFLEEPDRMGIRPRQTSTGDLRGMASGTEGLRYPMSSVRKELIRRYTDWLYPLVFFSLAAFLVLRTRPSREGPRWRLPVAVLAGFLIKALGLVLLGNAGVSAVAATASYVMPVTVAALLLGLALVRATVGRVRRLRAA